MKTTYCILGILSASLMSVLTGWAETPLSFGWSGVTPHVADYDGDGRVELGLYDIRQGKLYARKLNGSLLASGLNMALPGSISACADFDGDRIADLSSYDRDNGIFYSYLNIARVC